MHAHVRKRNEERKDRERERERSVCVDSAHCTLHTRHTDKKRRRITRGKLAGVKMNCYKFVIGAFRQDDIKFAMKTSCNHICALIGFAWTCDRENVHISQMKWKCKENIHLQQMHACFNHHHYLIDRLRLHSMAKYEKWNELTDLKSVPESSSFWVFSDLCDSCHLDMHWTAATVAFI